MGLKMNSELSEDNLHRLLNLIIANNVFKISFKEAENILYSYKLTLICGEGITETKALQAALLTAVNTGKRCFLGGVEVIMPERVPLLIYWPNKETLNDAVIELGGNLVKDVNKDSNFKLLFGKTRELKDSLHVMCNGWVGGVSELEITEPPSSSPDFALGGIVAGALGVAGAFFRLTGIRKFFGSEPTGISLWKPDVDWLLPDASGCRLEFLPKKLWVLGLGHLGQAYLWNLGLLLEPKIGGKIKIILQDFDIIKEANLSTGLLSESSYVGKKKTRVCAEWLEKRQVETTIMEQRFNANTRIDNGDPLVAICGFDKAEPRRFLEDTGFNFIVEAGLGTALDNFDQFMLHTFPDDKATAKEVWKEGIPPSKEIEQRLVEIYSKETGEKECGVLASTLAGKAIATSFVGTIAGAFVIAELLRGLHGERRYGSLSAQLRSLSQIDFSWLSSSQDVLTPNGFVSIGS